MKTYLRLAGSSLRCIDVNASTALLTASNVELKLLAKALVAGLITPGSAKQCLINKIIYKDVSTANITQCH